MKIISACRDGIRIDVDVPLGKEGWVYVDLEKRSGVLRQETPDRLDFVRYIPVAYVSAIGYVTLLTQQTITLPNLLGEAR